jgi:hypothetical protein
MATLQIGRKEINYEVRRSATALERRITITPGFVEVLALTADGEEEIAGFLARKRRWLFDAVREMECVRAGRHGVPRFSTGSKVPYRGRNMALTVRRTDAQRLEITYRNGFTVDLPEWAEANPDRLIASELKLWLKQSARRDVNDAAALIGKRFGLIPRSIRVKDFASGWGSCGREGNVLINWHLIFAPRKVLEYVVAHELAHLRHRTHERAFWTYVKYIMPDFERPKAWLEANQSILSDDFLTW